MDQQPTERWQKDVGQKNRDCREIIFLPVNPGVLVCTAVRGRKWMGKDSGEVGPICRLEYKPRKRLWEIAIYKYSDDYYDPEECFFPDNELVDGTIEGALKAGMKAYD